ncbi:anhydro-N-acetylmuramic acid kinase [Magnetospirillum sp. SS-4]|uniref:anhydro-N-acetylmuramic acid kinase n=1 Tax=Magnetospirillum sp. SS-4 TaxID=2681465 RepID=UPI001383C4E8|nr:anhydro-N-acetylmuramic acid kinase [Magnetospirillum sp. SS-4]CAA7626093.1 Anhydro-N-acetylmuramic acid kinase [Magnetospirillum sp. SS-4]
MLALGLMSGTSLDGIDAALVETDGDKIGAMGARRTTPYPGALRDRLRAVLGGVGDVAAVEREITLFHAGVARNLLSEAGVEPLAVGLIGFHGHTILHRPDQRRTWQIGDGALLAAETGIDVVNDFRAADVAAGGQGAPLVPAFHRALAGGLPGPLAVLNLGGVGNVTWIGADGGLLAFDTGPGNALIDDWALIHTGRPVDEDGALAAAGRAAAAAERAFLDHPYFACRPPKSLDRDDFRQTAMALVAGLSPADGAATLTALTAAAAAAAARHFPRPSRRWLVCGGGRRNPQLMAALRARLEVPVEAVEAVGWDGDAMEAQAFAYLAVRVWRGLPITFPETTGIDRPLTGGRIHRTATPLATDQFP